MGRQILILHIKIFFITIANLQHNSLQD